MSKEESFGVESTRYHCRDCGWNTPPTTLHRTPYAACPVCGGKWLAERSITQHARQRIPDAKPIKNQPRAKPDQPPNPPSLFGG